VNNRTPIILSVIAMSGLAIGASIALWHADAPPPAVATSAAAQSESTPRIRVTGGLPEYNPVQPLVIAYQARQSSRMADDVFTLRIGDSLISTGSTAAPVAEAVQAEPVTSDDVAIAPENEEPLKMPEPLNLRVPEIAESDEITSELADRNARRQPDSEKADAESFEPRGLALETSKVPSTPEVTSYSLFNPEYGLRGFMKQGWVNSSLGFQGGLGFNDGRRIQNEDDSLRDDIAVGMGVILAF